MNLILKILTRFGLVLTIIPSVIYLLGSMDLPEVKATMITGTLLWLIFAPVLQKQKEGQLVNIDTQDHI